MEGRHGEVGRSKGRSVMGRIEHAIWLNVKTGALLCLGEARAHVRQVFRCERVWRTFQDGKAKDGLGWCTRRRRDKMAQDRLGRGPSRSQKASDAYRTGCAGGPVDQGAYLARPAHPLVLRQAPGWQTSDLEPRKKHSRRRRCPVARRLSHMAGCKEPAPTWLQAETA